MIYALVTGGLGLIGTFITRQLLSEGHVDKVVCVDHFGRYSSSLLPEFIDYRNIRINMLGNQVIVERGEAQYMSVMWRMFEEYRPAYIFHLAALPLAKLDNLNSQEAMEGSAQSTSNMIELLGLMKRQSGYEPRRFVYASSSMVYGDFQSDVATEEHPTRPIEVYGTMKLAGEVITRGLGHFYGIDYSIVRPSAVYGPTDMNRRVSQVFIENAMKGETLKVYGRDEALDFTYVKDAANGFVLAATHPAGSQETFNITYGKAHTLLQFVLCLKQQFPDLDYEIVQRDDFRPRRGTLSIERARRLIGYTPRYSLKEGIAEYVSFMKDPQAFEGALHGH